MAIVMYTTFYLLAIARYALSVTVCDISTVEMHKTLTMIGPRLNINIPIDRPQAAFYVLAMFVLSLTVCEMITYALPNVLDRNLWPWKWRSRTLTILWKSPGECTLSTCIRATKLALLGPAFYSQYMIVHFATDGRTNAHTTRYHNAIHRRRNGAKTYWSCMC